jgi:tRNA/rRNA methyltransferase
LLPATIRDNLRVVLVETRNPLNIGAVARAMSNFGFLHLRLANPYTVAFQDARSAVGAAPLLANAEVYPTLDEAIADCSMVVGTTAFRAREAHHTMHSLVSAGSLIRAALTPGKVALLFGSETRGLSNDQLSRCQWLTHVPTREEHLSMNLGQAVAVSLYEIGRDEVAADSPSHIARAQAEDLERLTESLLKSLQLSGYIPPRLEESSERKIRRAVRRLELSHDDTTLWLGMLRQILWKLGGLERSGSHKDT